MSSSTRSLLRRLSKSVTTKVRLLRQMLKMQKFKTSKKMRKRNKSWRMLNRNKKRRNKKRNKRRLHYRLRVSSALSRRYLDVVRIEIVSS